MQAPVYIFDPTLTDSQSKVRGIGRYVQIIKENCPPDWIFTGTLKDIPSHAILIQPFYTFYQPPVIRGSITDRQIAVIHDVIPLKYPESYPIGMKALAYSLWQQWNLRYFDIIVTDSETSKKDIITYLKVKPEKIQVLFPTLANCFWNNPIKRTIPSEYCLYVGDGTWNKNLSTLAKAIKKTNITCVFAGMIFVDANPDNCTHPWQADLREFLREAQGDKRFVFAGYVSDEELLKLYVQAKLNILLSRDEGFGFSYVEASSQGCPSLLSDKPIFHEIAEQNASFVDCESAEKVAEVITALMGNPQKLASLSSGALEQAKKYNQESFKKQLLSIVYPY